MQVAFDIETNPIEDWLELSDLKEILCIAISVNGEDPKVLPIQEALYMMGEAKVLVGHNILSFDLPAIQKLHPTWTPRGRIIDTLVTARLLKANQREADFQTKDFPKEFIGSHALKAWGYRLNFAKAEAPGFDKATDELLEYCKQDVRVTNRLWEYLQAGPAFEAAQPAIDIEHAFARIIREQERHGFAFDVAAAERLHADLRKELLDIEGQLQKVFPPKVIDRVSEKTGKPLKPKIELFNPGSRMQIAERLKEKYGWEPTELTPDGRPRVDEAVLSDLSFPEAQILNRYLTVLKRLGQLAEGDEAWLKLVRKGRLHGRVNTNGAITGRCTHRNPNMAQVPSDPAYRRLFIPDTGTVLVGADASGLELRCLAHYLGRYDKGEYAKQILEGDIHWTNAKAFGLVGDVEQDKANPDHKAARNQAKGAIYALIYGAGDDKLGMVLGGDRKRGRKARANFEAKVPAYRRLKEDVTTTLGNYEMLKGLDGRPLYPRSEHAALNTLLQSAGAVVMKQACILAWNRFLEDPKFNAVHQVASIHDEYQFVAPREISEEVGKIVVWAIQHAGVEFKFRCKLDGEFRVGASWAETH
jgi:DNA polymerase I-like protein with 3'-5' exonuclease and polymerase domains